MNEIQNLLQTSLNPYISSLEGSEGLMGSAARMYRATKDKLTPYYNNEKVQSYIQQIPKERIINSAKRVAKYAIPAIGVGGLAYLLRQNPQILNSVSSMYHVTKDKAKQFLSGLDATKVQEIANKAMTVGKYALPALGALGGAYLLRKRIQKQKQNVVQPIQTLHKNKKQPKKYGMKSKR